MEYFVHLAILVFLYTILAQSLSLVAGYSGQVSIAHAGFFGIGAYTSALLSINFEASFPISLLTGMLLAGLFGFAVSQVTTKTSEDYYVILTLGIQVIVYSIMSNWKSVTGGAVGISEIPEISLFEIPLSKWSFLVLTALFTAIVWFILSNLAESPFGRVLRAISEDEVFAKSLGKNVSKAKIVSFTISGSLASTAGALYAHYMKFIDPTSFSLDESIFILSIVIIGGMRSLVGIFGATAMLILLPEALRFIGMSSSIAANMREVIYGVILILVVYRDVNKRYSLKHQAA